MTDNSNTAEKIAELLLQIKAIKLQPNDPFTWASGWKSPIYCDNRVSLFYPTVRSYICDALAEKINMHFAKPDVIAGVATGAISQGTLVSNAMDLPFIYVRSSPKEHGRKNLIEGEIREGQSVVVVEDLISTGGSSLKAVHALRDAGYNVLGMVSIFTYGFTVAANNFSEAKVKLVSLCDYEALLKKAVASNYINEKDLSSLSEWRKSPETWNPLKTQLS